MTDLLPEVEPLAEFSACETYRYLLRRIWAPGPRCCFILLNPSTADEQHDDPTLRRCIGFAKAWGYGSLVLGNLYALRATNPRELLRNSDPVGVANNYWLCRMTKEADLIVCGWGSRGLRVGDRLLKSLRNWGAVPHALRLTHGHQPAHPLYLPADLRPFRL